MSTKSIPLNERIPATRLLEARFKEPVRNEYQRGWNDALEAAVEQETDLIQHVGYTAEQCGYDK